MLTPQQTFKAGFLSRCASLGLDEPAMLAIVKEAQEKVALLGEIASKGLGMLTDTGKTLAGYAIPAALAAPPILGGIGGYGLARLTDFNDTDVAELKDREVLEAYKHNTERLKRLKAIRAYQSARQRTGRVL